MNKNVILCFSIINISIVCFIFIVEFLILPSHVQHILSVGLYVVAAIAGIVIGTLVSKIYNLRKKINYEHQLLLKKEKNIQEYLTNVVHDLRSPAASINMISELLEEDLEVDTLHADLISSVQKTSKDMLNRICCILDNAEMEHKNGFDELVFESPYPLIKAVIEKHKVLALDKDINIILEVPEDTPAIHFNKEALDSVFSNLVSNAIKYSLPKTSVRIYSIQRKKNIEFMVEDQGLGMTSEDLSMVFGRFAKLSARPTGKEDSSGIGLSLVKTMVERMNGSVKADSEGAGKGSTFTVTLPVAVKAQVLTA